MSTEHVPKHGKAGVAFAGTELKDSWPLIASVFGGLVLGGLFGWVAYVGLPVLGYLGTKAYIDWKSNRLPGYSKELFFRLGWSGYSTAFNRKKKLFIGDGKVVNPSALQMGAIVRAEASNGVAVDDVDTSTDFAAPLIEHDESQLVN